MTTPFDGNYPITSGWKPPNRPNHNGYDFGTPQGTPLKAIGNGKITVATVDQYGGAYVDLLLDDGMKARYIHLSKFGVDTNQRVAEGQTIGYSGGTPGSWGAGKSTGPHLHLEMYKPNAKQPFNWYPKLWSIMTQPPMPTPIYATTKQFEYSRQFDKNAPDMMFTWQTWFDFRSFVVHIGNLYATIDARDKEIESLKSKK